MRIDEKAIRRIVIRLDSSEEVFKLFLASNDIPAKSKQDLTIEERGQWIDFLTKQIQRLITMLTANMRRLGMLGSRDVRLN